MVWVVVVVVVPQFVSQEDFERTAASYYLWRVYCFPCHSAVAVDSILAVVVWNFVVVWEVAFEFVA